MSDWEHSIFHWLTVFAILMMFLLARKGGFPGPWQK